MDCLVSSQEDGLKRFIYIAGSRLLGGAVIRIRSIYCSESLWELICFLNQVLSELDHVLGANNGGLEAANPR